MNYFEIGAKCESPCGRWRRSGRLNTMLHRRSHKVSRFRAVFESSSSHSPQVLLAGAPKCGVLLFLTKCLTALILDEVYHYEKCLSEPLCK